MMTAREHTNRLALLLRNEQGALADFLLALAAFDGEKRWRELGHTSLFYFLHRELGLSKGAAQNRKTAAELIQAFPEVEAALRRGDLCLSTINEVAKVLTPENRGEVLPRFFGLSRSEAEVVVASLRPAEIIPLREVVTSVRPARPPRGVEAALAPVLALAPVPTAPVVVAVHLGEPDQPDPVPAVLLRAPPPPRDSVDPLDADRARLHVTVSRRFLEKLEAAKDALGHACPEGSAEEILERGLDLVLAEHAKRQGQVEKPRKARGPVRSVAVPAEVKREVWRRAGGRCEWVFESGERCDARRRLEYDHLDPVALGGVATVERIRLTCRPHNLLAARQIFGDALMDGYVRPRRSGPRRLPPLEPGPVLPGVEMEFEIRPPGGSA